MARIILVEGPDNAGKSTFINELLEHYQSKVQLLTFPKRNIDGERFTIATRNEVAIFEEMLMRIDNSKTYILDRGYLSNIVYEQLRGEDPARYMGDYERLLANHELFTVGLSRNYLEHGFEDDLIKLSADEFNKVIDLFDHYYEYYGIPMFHRLTHDPHNKVIGVSHIDPIKHFGLNILVN